MIGKLPTTTIRIIEEAGQGRMTEHTVVCQAHMADQVKEQHRYRHKIKIPIKIHNSTRVRIQSTRITMVSTVT